MVHGGQGKIDREVMLEVQGVDELSQGRGFPGTGFSGQKEDAFGLLDQFQPGLEL
jgi:hypothetical protein